MSEEEKPSPRSKPTPFRILGWCPDRQRIHYQHSQTGQISSVRPGAQASTLLQLAPFDHWVERFGNEKDDKVTAGGWDKALDSVITSANTAGVFTPEQMRGRGVWMDGDAVVWHLGDRLEVNGRRVELIDHRSSHHYPRLPALAVDPQVATLTDGEGQSILETIRSMGWAGAHDALHLAGWVVLATVGGALECRPVLQLTNPHGGGKSYTKSKVIERLLAGLAVSRSNSTEAGIRQTLKADSLPAIIDESEAEDPARRAGHLKLARLSFDGTATDRGTTHGQALSYAVRSSICLIGINAVILNAADRSRTVVISRQQLPAAEWQPVEKQITERLSTTIGARLLRRAVTHLPTLRANAQTFRRAVEGQLAGSGAARAGDTYGHLLAGAHLLISTAEIDDGQALGWLDEIGWSAAAAMGETGGDVVDGAAEAWQCLRHLLSHEEPWKLETGTGRITIGELLRERTPDAIAALGRRGIKVTDVGLVVANDAAALAPIYGRTKWAQGGHVARLRDLPGSYPSGQTRFNAHLSGKGTTIPSATVEGQP